MHRQAEVDSVVDAQIGSVGVTMDEKLPLIGTAVIGAIFVVIGVVLTDGAWKAVMILPLLILAAGLFWSARSLVPDSQVLATGPAGPPPGANPTGTNDAGASGTRTTSASGTRTTSGVGINGDVMTVGATMSNTPGSDGVAGIDRDTPARHFEFVASELSGDPDRLQCPRCGRFEGTRVEHEAGSIACESCNAVFRVSPNAVAFVRTFDLGMVVADDPLSISTRRTRTSVPERQVTDP